jgi:hypothetical protein
VAEYRGIFSNRHATISDNNVLELHQLLLALEAWIDGSTYGMANSSVLHFDEYFPVSLDPDDQ